MSEPCGSWRVVERDEGTESRVRWCARTDGPCPFPGTPESTGSARKCADSPGRRLTVHYADEAVVDARDRLRRCIANGDALTDEGTIHVAIAALTACIGDDA